MFGKNQNLEFQCVEKLKFRMAMFRKANIYNSFKCLENVNIWNSNVWKKENLEFQCLEKGEIYNWNVWKRPKFRMKAKFRIAMFGKRRNMEFQCLEKAKILNSGFSKL